MKFNISLPIFSGPIELLLYLIRKEEVSIFEIPIATVTNQFLEFIRGLSELKDQPFYSDLSDFLLMATVLIRIKLRKLIPTSEEKSEEVTVSIFEIYEEFERYKKLASLLSSLEEERSALFTRPKTIPTEEEELDIVDLMKIFYHLQKKGKEKLFIEKPPFRLEERIALVREKIEKMQAVGNGKGEKEFLTFFGLLKEAKDIKDIVIIFFALLELAFLGEVKLIQEKDFGDILVIPLKKKGKEGRNEN
ncbi:MAG: segregation/condensation protein A [candidate division WOR-3 bacterium]